MCEKDVCASDCTWKKMKIAGSSFASVRNRRTLGRRMPSNLQRQKGIIKNVHFSIFLKVSNQTMVKSFSAIAKNKKGRFPIRGVPDRPYHRRNTGDKEAHGHPNLPHSGSFLSLHLHSSLFLFLDFLVAWLGDQTRNYLY